MGKLVNWGLTFLTLGAIVGCSGSHAILSTDAKRYVPMVPGSRWVYRCYDIDSAGERHERKAPLVDSAVTSYTSQGRAVSVMVQARSYEFEEQLREYSFSPAGDLQMWVDTSNVGRQMSWMTEYTSRIDGAAGYWQQVTGYSMMTVGGCITQRFPLFTEVITIGSRSRDEFKGIRTHHSCRLPDTVLTVPAGTFTAQVRLDSIVDTLKNPRYPLAIVTMVTRRYVAEDVGIVREAGYIRIPPALATAFQKEKTSFIIAPFTHLPAWSPKFAYEKELSRVDLKGK